MEQNNIKNTSQEDKPSFRAPQSNIMNRALNEAHLATDIKKHQPNIPHSGVDPNWGSSPSTGEEVEETSAMSQIANSIFQSKTNAVGQASFLAQVKSYWDKIPSFIKPILPMVLGYAGVAIAVILFVIFVIAAPTGLVQSVIDGVPTFGEKLGNFFTFQGFQTNDELSEKRETEFYETLKNVQEDFREKYKVTIDVDLITATLFYNRMMGDYNVDSTDDEFVDDEAEGDPKAAADFYKIAKGHIKTLARYMIVENQVSNSCGDTPYQDIHPKEEKDLAKEWGVFGGIHNKRTITNVYPYQKTFPYCEYGGDKDGYRDLREQILTRENELKTLGDEDLLRAFHEEYFYPSEEEGTTTPKPGTSGDVNRVERLSYEVVPTTDQSKKDEDIVWTMKSCSELDAVSVGGKCYLKNPNPESTYSASYQRESVYYYRLMEPMELAWGAIQGKSFIESYYPEFIGEDTKEEDIQRIVEEIYSLYDMIRETKGKFTGSIGTASGEWYTWKQYDPAWDFVPLGTDPDITLHNYGCLMTSIAMQIVASGTPITISNFNPGTFVAAMPFAFDSGGSWTGGNTWSAIAPNFIYIDQPEIYGDTNVKAETVAQWISEGYYLVARVKYNKGQHWVAITGVENGSIIMADPGDSTSTDMFMRYPETQGHELVVKRFKG